MDEFPFSAEAIGRAHAAALFATLEDLTVISSIGAGTILYDPRFDRGTGLAENLRAVAIATTLGEKSVDNVRREFADHQFADHSLAMSGIRCKPGCMARGRYSKAKARREDAYRRQREATAAAATAARDLEAVWGGPDEGLHRLRDISHQLEKLHRAEHTLLRERDHLIAALRTSDVSWNMLSTWSGLSRQALSKRQQPR